MVEWTAIKGNILHLRIIDTDRARARLYELLTKALQLNIDEIPSVMIKRVGLYGYNSAGQIDKGKISWPEK